ncbi:MAG: GTP-binding protein [archaeon GB-1867-035]|nr:GTP-binding protein [Candidatus Culexmicrobium profundum]
MVTGATYGDAAILVVDVIKGIEEQSERHAYLISLLGIKRVIVAINKMDLIDYDEAKFNAVKKNALSYLSSINIKPLYILPISAYKGDFLVHRSENLSWYTGSTIVETLDSLEDVKLSYDFRMSIQD